jgi:hypothetical protein
MPVLEFENHFSAPADQVWQALISPKILAQTSFPILTLTPSSPAPEKWSQGASISVKLRLFGIVPWGNHRIEFLELDNDTRFCSTWEYDENIQSWNHQLQVSVLGPSTRIARNRIEFEAGIFNGFVRWFSTLLYRHRYRSLKRLLSSQNP